MPDAFYWLMLHMVFSMFGGGLEALGEIVSHKEEGDLRWAWTGDVWKILYAFKLFRPDLRVSILDCPPTGLVAVRGLDPSSTVLSSAVLSSRYEEVLAKAGSLVPDDARMAELWALYPTLDTTALATARHGVSAVLTCR